MSAEFLILHGRTTSVVLDLDGTRVPAWRYWGLRLADGVMPPSTLAGHRPLPSFALDADMPLVIFPAFGLGWTGQSALLAHRGGHDFAQGFALEALERKGSCAARLMLRDDVAKLHVVVTIALDPENDVLALSTALTNEGDSVLDVQWLSAGCVPLPAAARTVRSYGGRHNYEFVADDAPLGRALWARENRRGLTSHEDFPGAVVLGDHMAWGAQLAWSGNHVQTIAPLDDGRRQWQMGEWLAPGEIRLAPGETLASPAMLATCAPDTDGVAQNFHAAIRARSPVDPGKARLVHLNTWEALYFDHREDDLIALADAAAAIGIERFVLDDGWFKGRHNDMSSLGDWTVDPGKFPQGLGGLATHVTGLGMGFGLWVEPEMVNPDSDLFRQHPEWALQIAGRPMVTARRQLVLDLSNTAVVDYLFDALSALLLELPISYLKWDHNRMLTSAGNGQRHASYRQQVIAFYALLDQIRIEFPDVEIESCAGGGGRIDAGVAMRSHRFWISDTTDAVARLEIQRGFLQFMPPELMGAHVGSVPVHTTGRTQTMDFRAAVALPGHFGVELDPRKIGDDERAVLQKWIARFKVLRGRLHSGGVWHGTAGDGVTWQAHGDAGSLLLFAWRVTPPVWRYPPEILLPMLDQTASYRVERIDSVAKPMTIAGGWLIAGGFSLPPTKAEHCAIFSLVRAGQDNPAIDC